MQIRRMKLTSKTLSDIIEDARRLAEGLAVDVRQASTRVEHIRVTARANEAQLLLEDLERLNGGEQTASVDG